jgi:TPR repeat protein
LCPDVEGDEDNPYRQILKSALKEVNASIQTEFTIIHEKPIRCYTSPEISSRFQPILCRHDDQILVMSSPRNSLSRPSDGLPGGNADSHVVTVEDLEKLFNNFLTHYHPDLGGSQESPLTQTEFKELKNGLANRIILLEKHLLKVESSLSPSVSSSTGKWAVLWYIFITLFICCVLLSGQNVSSNVTEMSNGFIVLQQSVSNLTSEYIRISHSFSAQIRRFSNEQLYRRGCECLYGTNGFGESGEHLTRVLGLSWLKNASDLGHTDAQYQYGKSRLMGLSCVLDTSEAVKYLRMSIDGGSTYAQIIYAMCLMNGTGVARNVSLAYELATEAAEARNAIAEAVLASWFNEGTATPKNPEQAYLLASRSAEQGNVLGINILGFCLLNGLGVDADPVRGAILIKQAADVGVANALFNYGVLLLRGKGVTRNRKRAAQYLKKAMEKDFPGAKQAYEMLRQ